MGSLLKEEKERILISAKKALEMGKGRLSITYKLGKTEKEESFSSHFSCPDCNISLPDIEPKIFSFNSPFGACKTCQGLGKLAKVNKDLILNPRLSLNQGAILPWFSLGRWSLRTLGVPYQKWSLQNLAEKVGFSLDEPFQNLPEHIQLLALRGDKAHPDFEGIIPRMERAYRETTSEYLRSEISKYMSEIECPACGGARLSPEVLAIKVGGKSIHELSAMPIRDEIIFFENLDKDLTDKEKEIAPTMVREICKRLSFLDRKSVV